MVPWGRWMVGLSLALLSAILSSLGLTLQRLGTLWEERELEVGGDRIAAAKKCQRMRWLGVGLYMVAAAPDVISYVLVPQVVCSAIACFRLTIVSVMAYAVLGERLYVRQTIGMVACTLGTFLCLCFGPVKMEKAAMIAGFHHPPLKIYLVAGGVVFLLLFGFEHLDAVSSKCVFSARCRTFVLPLIAGLAFAISKVFNSMIGFVPRLQGEWIAMAGAVAALGLTDFYLNMRATRLMAVQVFVPVAFVWCITLQYFQSAVLFEEFAGLNNTHAGLSILGACISLVGALCIQLQLPEPYAKSVGSDWSPSQSGVSLPDMQERGGDKARIFLEA